MKAEVVWSKRLWSFIDVVFNVNKGQCQAQILTLKEFFILFNPFGDPRPKSPLDPYLTNTSFACCRPIPAFATFSFIPLETGRSWREITALRITHRLEMLAYTSSTVRKLPHFTKFSAAIRGNKTSDKALQPLLKLVNYSCSSYPTRASYSGQVDGFRNPIKTSWKHGRVWTPVFETISNTDANFLNLHIDKATKTRGDKQLI